MVAATAASAAASCLLVVSSPPAGAYDNPFSSSSAITVNSATSPPPPATASPYPSAITVSGVTGTITNLTVTLTGISGPVAQDLSVLLVGPGNQSLVLFAGVGPSSGATTGLNVTLDDTGSSAYSTAGASLPTSGSVTMIPTDLANNVPGSGVFPSPAPAVGSSAAATPTGSATLNSVFDGANPNGTWDLYVVDDANDGGGTLSSWSLDITSANAQAISFTSTAPSNATVGGPTYQAAATGGGSGNPVTLSIDASSTSVCSIDSSGIVSFTATGTCTIDANQAGNSDYTAAPQQQQSFTVGKGSQTITFTSTPPANAAVGGTYTVTATASSGLAVTFTIDSS
ncbi:MAG: hypothetical protein KGL16_09590, partial [Acidobacteriota bacterium]|nr:hypothetical protein [Acidobacteriota bacterium]